MTTLSQVVSSRSLNVVDVASWKAAFRQRRRFSLGYSCQLQNTSLTTSQGHRSTIKTFTTARDECAAVRRKTLCDCWDSSSDRGLATATLPLSVSSRRRPTSAIRTIQQQLLSGERSAVEVLETYLSTAEALEPDLRSFLLLDRESALKQAKAVDLAVADLRSSSASGASPLPRALCLAGAPVAVKDNLCTAGAATTAGSRVLRGFLPPFDATAVARVKAAGGVVLGKTNMDEFGMGSTTEGSGFQVTSNPWDLSRVPGGSSGGSAAAVAAGQCAVALGSDTGGSVRQPAAFCGVVGLKPTFGRVSRFGLLAYASSLDCVGCLAGSVEDAALLLEAVAGRDERDATSSRQPPADFTSLLRPPSQLSSAPLAGLRLGLVSESLGRGQGPSAGGSAGTGIQPEVVEAVDAAARHLQALGAMVEEVSLPFFNEGLPAYYILAPSEASSNLARYDGVRFGPFHEAGDVSSLYAEARGDGFGKEVKRRIMMGTYALSAGYYDAFYKRAQQVRALVRQQFNERLASFDALVTPTAPSFAYKKGDKSSDPLSMYLGDLMTVNVNLSGLPAISVPCSFAMKHHLPVGLQIIGKAFSEPELLRICHTYEQTVHMDAV